MFTLDDGDIQDIKLWPFLEAIIKELIELLVSYFKVNNIPCYCEDIIYFYSKNGFIFL